MMRQLLLLLVLLPAIAWAQVPEVKPTGTYYRINENGEEETGDVNEQTLSAPFRVAFAANTGTIPSGYSSNVHYTWTVTNTKDPAAAPIMRTEQDFELEFQTSGTYTVQLRAIFYDETGAEPIYEFPEEGEEPQLITFTVSESKLEFPNGISPNGDGHNDELRAKDGYQSIVSFRAAVFNRWGQKLYSWDDVRGHWDGKVGGKPVKDGVYFLVVSAKGGDGIDYNIKKAINVISGYNNAENGGSSEGGDE